MATLRLNYGLTVLVDYDDLARVEPITWYIQPHRQTYYARGRLPFGRQIFLHRFLMGEPTAEAHVVDHIDGHGWNNTRINLRWVSPKANSQNRHVANPGYFGIRPLRLCGDVFWQWTDERWHTWHGCFDSPLAAAIAHDRCVVANGLRDAPLNLDWDSVASELPSPPPPEIPVFSYPEFPS